MKDRGDKDFPITHDGKVPMDLVKNLKNIWITILLTLWLVIAAEFKTESKIQIPF